MADRTCVDCGAPISRRAKARCRPCGIPASNRDPVRRAKAAVRMRARFQDAGFRERHRQAARDGMAKAMEDPAFAERRRELGHRYGTANIAGRSTPASRAKAGRAISERAVAHIPPAYRTLYRELKQQNLTAAERERLVRDQIEIDRERGRRIVLEIQSANRARHERRQREAY